MCKLNHKPVELPAKINKSRVDKACLGFLRHWHSTNQEYKSSSVGESMSNLLVTCRVKARIIIYCMEYCTIHCVVSGENIFLRHVSAKIY